MKKGIELGVCPISPKNKKGNEQLTKALYEINEVMYSNGTRFISPIMADKLYQTICEMGKKIKTIEAPNEAAKKKEELLVYLRMTCNSLKQYATHYQWGPSDAEQVQSSLGYQLSIYLKDKEALDIPKTIRLLEQNKQIWDEMYIACPFRNEVKKTLAFEKMQEELLEKISSSYSLK